MASLFIKKLTDEYKKVQAGVSNYLKTLDLASGGRLKVIQDAITQYTISRSADAASSLAFWWVFSLFPMMAILVIVASYIVDPGKVLDIVLNLLSPIVPFSTEMIAMNLIRFIRMRGTFGFLASIGFIWSASNVFMILYTNINIAWDKARFRNFLFRRLIALGMVGVILLLLILVLFLSTMLDILTGINFQIPGVFINHNQIITWLQSNLVSILITFIIFFALYRWIPNTRVKSTDAFLAAILCTAVWELTSTLFKAYLDSGLAGYDVLFGSLATLAVLMFWFYLNSVILLFGAHLSAAIARRRLKLMVAAENKPG
jgi:membrane protein